MQATRTLPPGYREVGTLDLRNNRRALVALNIAGVVLLVLAGIVFPRIGLWLRPEAAAQLSLQFFSTGGMIKTVFGLLAIVALMLVVHEAIHGVFFWLFTRSRPKFGIGAGYAYATAPGWFLPRGQYLIVGLAPLVIISAAGMTLAVVAPLSWFAPLLTLVIMNASGAVGDLAVIGWLLMQPVDCLAQDNGDAVTLYRL